MYLLSFKIQHANKCLINLSYVISVKVDIDQGSYEDSAMQVHYIPMKPKESLAEEQGRFG